MSTLVKGVRYFGVKETTFKTGASRWAIMNMRRSGYLVPTLTLENNQRLYTEEQVKTIKEMVSDGSIRRFNRGSQ